MRAVLQRVKEARVKVEQNVVAQIGKGLLVLLGVGRGDTAQDIPALANRIINLRIFEDERNKLNYSIRDIKAEILLVSQFTLYADCKKGRRPSFDKALSSSGAEIIFEGFFDYLKSYNIAVKKGIFGAKMEVELINQGPLTIILDTEL